MAWTRENRPTFLLRLTDALRSVADPIRIQHVAMQVLGEHLRVGRAFCFLVERQLGGTLYCIEDEGWNSEDTATSLAGRYALDSYSDVVRTLARGEAVVLTDVSKSESLSIEEMERLRSQGCLAVVAAPVVKEGVLAGGVCVQSFVPREWTEDELILVSEVAERTWNDLDRARAGEALRESRAWLVSQRDAFQADLTGAPLRASLEVLLETAVKQVCNGVRCAFYIADYSGTSLCHVAGMPPSYAECVDGFQISPDSLACGLAVHERKPVITPDVRLELRWKPWLWLAEKYEYRACWSFPLQMASGKVLGTLAMYFKEPREASPRDYEIASFVTNAAAIIIARNLEMQERERTETALDRFQKQYVSELEQSVASRTAELQLRVSERDALLAELHHRVKNNLQVIISMLEMQARRTDNFEAHRQLEEACNRVLSIAQIHELLYQSSSLTKIDLVEHAHKLVPQLIAFYNLQDRVELEVIGDAVSLDIELAVPYSVLLNELVSNACKHAFSRGERGRLTVQLASRNEEIRLTVKDTGVGMPPELDISRSDSLGLTIVRLLADQLGGTLTIRGDKGTCVELYFSASARSSFSRVSRANSTAARMEPL